MVIYSTGQWDGFSKGDYVRNYGSVQDGKNLDLQSLSFGSFGRYLSIQHREDKFGQFLRLTESAFWPIVQ